MRPDIFKYFSYKEFLKDWVAYLKATQPSFSIRSLAAKSGIAVGYISSVTAGKRRLTKKSLAKFSPYLKLQPHEISYFESLIELQNSNSSDLKAHALKKMNRFSGFRKLNDQEMKTASYLSKWYYVAIREMVSLDEFRLDPDWIQSRLRYSVSKAEIQKAIKFLIDNRFIVLKNDGSLKASEEDIECFDMIYSMSLKQHYKQMFDIAKSALDHVPTEERYVLGYTFNLDEEGFKEAKSIMNQAFTKLRKLENKDGGQDKETFNFSTYAIPLTDSKKGDQND